MWHQREIRLRPQPRGYHLITGEVEAALPELGELRVGLAHLHILHTSASLTLNENASPDVRDDFAAWFDRAVPEDAPYWTHTIEGPDDMPAHIKASLLGPVAHPAGARGALRARHVAGDLPVRAPRPRRRAVAGRDAGGGVSSPFPWRDGGRRRTSTPASRGARVRRACAFAGIAARAAGVPAKRLACVHFAGITARAAWVPA